MNLAIVVLKGTTILLENSLNPNNFYTKKINLFIIKGYKLIFREVRFKNKKAEYFPVIVQTFPKTEDVPTVMSV